MGCCTGWPRRNQGSAVFQASWIVAELIEAQVAGGVLGGHRARVRG